MSGKLSENGMIPAEDLYYLLGGKERICLFDATYAMPAPGVSPYQGFLNAHIDGAQFFDIDVVADQEAPLPHTLPTAEYFASCVSALGVSNQDHVVIYDQSRAYMASSRAWWMFRTFGHENVYVLEGGLQAWSKGGYKTVSGPAEPPTPGEFVARFRPELVVDRNDLLNNIETRSFDVVDARPAGRFHGQSPEPRPGMRAGHIPGSINLPFGELIDPQTRHLGEAAALEQVFQATGIGGKPVAVSCGSGVTACTVALALYKASGKDAAIYDGSWSEWGEENAGTPVEVSA